MRGLPEPRRSLYVRRRDTAAPRLQSSKVAGTLLHYCLDLPSTQNQEPHPFFWDEVHYIGTRSILLDTLEGSRCAKMPV